jgi:signal transduction histidine kinase
MKSTILLRIILLAGFVWTAAIGGLVVWDERVERRHAEDLAKKEARSNFNKDQAFRMWATRHGGVYVPADARTPPNPGLKHIPERDIETPSGKKLTLMNPAYILRQVMDEYSELYGIKGRITSFQLINPDNAPDPWESAALRRFELGEKEVFEFAEMNGQPYLRLMRPMMVVSGCLKCHGFQGYKEGDVRGGVGVAVPMQPYLSDLGATLRAHRATLGAIWLLGLGAIAALILQVRRRFDEQARAADQLQQRNRVIDRTNADLQRFAEVTAHHLQEPARRIATYAERMTAHLADRLGDDEARLSLDVIGQEARRQKNLLHDIERYLAADQPRGKLGPTDTSQIVAAILARLTTRISAAGAEITVGALPPAWIDAPRLADVFEVVLDNALRHGAVKSRRWRDGDATANQADAAQEVALEDTALRITIDGQRRGSVVRYSISDNGPGVEEQYRERVFRVFERLASSDQGTGIGLAIARRIAESCGGRAWIEEAPGGGCRIVFELPAEEMV